jgi:hypothetical protein
VNTRVFKAAAFVFLVCLIIEIFLQFFGDRLPSRLNTFYLPPQEYYREGAVPILILGDSITAWGLDKSYPSIVQQYLNEAAPGKFFVVNGAKIGESSASLLESFKSEVQKLKPEIVISMIGLNDFKLTGQLKFWQRVRLVAVAEHLLLVGYNSLKGVALALQPKKEMTPVEVFNPATAANWQQIEQEIHHYLSNDANLSKHHAVLDYLINRGANNSQKAYYLAIEIANTVLNRWPGDSFAADMRGIAGISVPLSAETESYLKAAYDLKTENPLLYVYYSKQLAKAGKRDEGLRVAKELIKKENGLTGRNKQVIEHEFPELKTAQEEKVYLNTHEQNLVTAGNYKKLSDMADELSIHLMILPYPMTDISEIQQILSDKKNIEFLDYGDFFQNSNSAYAEYFTDRSAVTFGHLTLKSNQYVAKVVAEAILNYTNQTKPQEKFKQ